jgi:sigma-B regulation protein RsbU (phosphoserine phosphatase)
MTKVSLAERLRHNILFENVDDTSFGVLRQHFAERRFAAGEIIVEDESDGNELFLLAEGRVRILKMTRFGEEKLLALLHPGDFFGELELVDGRPRSARVVAVDDCVTFVMPKEEFDRLLASSHPFAVRLMQVLGVRLRALNKHFVGELEQSARRSRAELKKLERLIEATKVVNSTLNLDNLLNIILETALKIVDGDRGTLYLIDKEKHMLWSKVFLGSEPVRIELAVGKGIAGYVAATGDVLNIPDAYMDPRFNPDFDRMTGYRTKSILCMPMRTKDDEIIGVFQLLNKHTGFFTRDDESFIRSLSIHAAIAIENARLHEQERQKHMMEKELFAAREVQMSLVPQELPAARTIEFAACTMPAREVGGDLYDFIRLDPDRCEVVVADVAGKGLPAALLATLTKGVLFSQAMHGTSPETHLKGSNHIVRRNFPRKSFITVLLAVVDERTRSVTLANAGHCYPILYRCSAGSAQEIPVKGMALNIHDDIRCEEKSIALEPGDSIILYSDGVTEAMNEGGEFFGVERLESVVEQNGRLAASALKESIVRELGEFSRGASQHDDITLVVIRALP